VREVLPAFRKTNDASFFFFLLILQSFEWLAAFQPELVQAILFIAV
jgi:hypothetical protein